MGGVRGFLVRLFEIALELAVSHLESVSFTGLGLQL